MVNQLLFFLPGILALGIATSYSDIKEGKIRNKWILFSIIYSLIIHSYFIFTKTPISDFYIKQTLSNLVISLVLGFVMWDFGLWTAGDGKLLLGYSALVPIITYNKPSYIPYFPSGTILINTFVTAFLFLFLYSLFKSSWKVKKRTIKKTLNPKSLANKAANLFVFTWVIQKAMSTLNTNNWIFTVVLAFVFFSTLEKISFGKKNLGTYVLLTIILFFDASVRSQEFLKGFSALFLVILLFRSLVSDLGFNTFTKEVKIKDLKPGMVPAEVTYVEKEKAKKRRISYLNIIQYIKDTRNKDVFDMKSEGMSGKDIQNIRTLAKKHKDLKTFRVQEMLPFAPFMFAGAILTLASQGNVFFFLAAITLRFFGKI
jgi:Flp pilus assembly protein protease CpaA